MLSLTNIKLSPMQFPSRLQSTLQRTMQSAATTSSMPSKFKNPDLHIVLMSSEVVMTSKFSDTSSTTETCFATIPAHWSSASSLNN